MVSNKTNELKSAVHWLYL